MIDCQAQIKLNRLELIIQVRYVLALFLLLALSVMFLSVQASANQTKQTAASKERKGSIKGRVVNEGGQAFANAIVSVDPLSGADNDKRQILTEEDGSFQVKELAAIPYKITCQAEGYVEEKSDDTLLYHTIGDSVTLQLKKGGVITGMVTDTKGIPIENAQVNITRVGDAREKPVRLAETYGRVITDDRGIYRFYGLYSGSYIVFVNEIGNFEDEDTHEEISVYYPSATRNAAQIVKVSTGAEVDGINIIYRSERGHSISGTFSGAMRKSNSSSKAYIKLIHAKSGTIEAGAWRGDETDRTFAFHSVPDGEYYLLAQDQDDEPNAASAPRQITVKGDDITGIELVLVPFASLEGRFSIETLPESPNKALCKEVTQSSLEEIILTVAGNNAKNLKQLPPWLIENSNSTVPDEKGMFIFRSLAPGQYRFGLSLLREDLYIRSINVRPTTIKDSNKGQRSTIDLKTGERATGTAITLARGAARLQGRIAPANESDKIPLRVYLVPSEAEYADQDWRFAETNVQSDGTYTFKNLAPGHYRFVLRAANKEEASEALYPKISDAPSRKILQREAESANLAVELQTCQQITNFLLPYPLPSAKTKSPGGEKEELLESPKVKAKTTDVQPVIKKAKRTKK